MALGRRLQLEFYGLRVFGEMAEGVMGFRALRVIDEWVECMIFAISLNSIVGG